MGSAVQEEAASRIIIDITDLHHPVLTARCRSRFFGTALSPVPQT